METLRDEETAAASVRRAFLLNQFETVLKACKLKITNELLFCDPSTLDKSAPVELSFEAPSAQEGEGEEEFEEDDDDPANDHPNDAAGGEDDASRRRAHLGFLDAVVRVPQDPSLLLKYFLLATFENASSPEVTKSHLEIAESFMIVMNTRKKRPIHFETYLVYLRLALLQKHPGAIQKMQTLLKNPSLLEDDYDTVIEAVVCFAGLSREDCLEFIAKLHRKTPRTAKWASELISSPAISSSSSPPVRASTMTPAMPSTNASNGAATPTRMTTETPPTPPLPGAPSPPRPSPRPSPHSLFEGWSEEQLNTAKTGMALVATLVAAVLAVRHRKRLGDMLFGDA